MFEFLARDFPNTYYTDHIVHSILSSFPYYILLITHVQFLPSNISSMAGQRVEEGHLTINFQGVNWNMVVISDAKDKATLQMLYELLERMRTGENLSGKEAREEGGEDNEERYATFERNA